MEGYLFEGEQREKILQERMASIEESNTAIKLSLLQEESAVTNFLARVGLDIPELTAWMSPRALLSVG